MVQHWKRSTSFGRVLRILEVTTRRWHIGWSWMSWEGFGRTSLVEESTLLLTSCRNDIVHSHIRNMSMANIMPKSRPGVLPNAQSTADEVGRLRKGQDDLVKERSGLADMLYLRCESFFASEGRH